MAGIVTYLEQHLVPCYFKTHFGFGCPGCGMQRSVISLLKGNVIESMQFHPAVMPLLFTFGFTIAHLIFKFKTGHRIVLISYIVTISIFVVNFLLRLSGIIEFN